MVPSARENIVLLYINPFSARKEKVHKNEANYTELRAGISSGAVWNMTDER